jgi:hypothetical protein
MIELTDALQTASPTLLKAPVGKVQTFGRSEFWRDNLLKLPLGFEAPLVKRIRDADGNADFGLI